MAITKSDQYHFQTFTVSAGTTETAYVDGLPLPLTVAAHPGSGGTAGVETTNSGTAAVEAASATWVTWDEGTVSVDTPATLWSPVTALRFTATTADAEFTVTAPRK